MVSYNTEERGPIEDRCYMLGKLGLWEWWMKVLLFVNLYLVIYLDTFSEVSLVSAVAWPYR